jgi:hypothetical protein
MMDGLTALQKSVDRMLDIYTLLAMELRDLLKVPNFGDFVL